MATSHLTWEQLVEAEPQLAELEASVCAVKATDDTFCAHAVWYGYGREDGGLRGRLIALVGWNRNHPVLGSMAAYDLAYERLYDALPDCRHEGGC